MNLSPLDLHPIRAFAAHFSDNLDDGNDETSLNILHYQSLTDAPPPVGRFESSGSTTSGSATSFLSFLFARAAPPAPQVYQITDAGIAADLKKYEKSGALDYQGLLNILKDAAVGGMTGTEFTSLEGLAQKLNGTGSDAIKTSTYLQYIASALITGNAANATWTGGGSAKTLGNLQAASSATQVTELIDKWFLGRDRPNDGGAKYVNEATKLKLYGASGTPVIGDVNQGALGDCYLVASIAEVALEQPDVIKSMITNNGNNTYGVRFFENGKPVYVTVDATLPTGGNWANGSNLEFVNGSVLWPALIEKAYAELAQRMDGSDNSNSYAGLAGGSGYPIIEMTGKSMTGYVVSKPAQYDSFAQTLSTALKSGEELLWGSISSTIGLTSTHMYSVTNIDTAQDVVTLRDPHGNRTGTNPYVNESLAALSHDQGYFLGAIGAGKA